MRLAEFIQRALARTGLDGDSAPMRRLGESLRRAVSPDAPASGEVLLERSGALPQDAAQLRELAPHPQPAGTPPGSFTTHQFASRAGARKYKLYVPGRALHRAPLVVMLHGCRQSADDLAAGTGMNRHADRQGFIVAYPEQSPEANASMCWNWFSARDQLRDAGEPSLIAGIVREVAARHDVDPRRIFIAGMSAGAAMALILGEAYPDLFAAVGVHSGVPYGSAHDLGSALSVMKGRGSAMPLASGVAAALRRKAARAVPVIVFHGDRDRTVQHANAEEIIEQAIEAHVAAAAATALSKSTHTGVAGGRAYTRTVHADATGRARVESWTLHGAGHAWSGGHPSGSFTDPDGPDASAEMIRFFLQLQEGDA
jgi:poly(hydroxyalkanoate) depolymerase family esterase